MTNSEAMRYRPPEGQRPDGLGSSRISVLDTVRLSRCALVAGVLLMSYGLPLALVGVPQYASQRWEQILIAAMVPLFVLRAMRQRKANRFHVLAIGYFAVVFAVSWLYNTLVVPHPVASWVPGLLVFMPVLLFALYDLGGVTIREIAAGFVLTSVLCASLTVVDAFVHIPSLDAYVRASREGPGVRRLVLAKTEEAFSVPLLFLLLVRVRSYLARWAVAACLGLVIYALAVTSESRLAIAATAIGMLVFMAFVARGPTRIGPLYLLAGGALLFMPALFPGLFDFGSLLSTDTSIGYRLLENTYFAQHFDTTGGLGFGAMSVVQGLDNILSVALFSGGELIGAPGAPVGLEDLGIPAALYQFGYVGLLSVVILTGVMTFTFMRAGTSDRYPNRMLFGAFGSIVVGFLASPLPMNFFSLSWTVTFGGTLWYAMSRVATEGPSPSNGEPATRFRASSGAMSRHRARPLRSTRLKSAPWAET